jgi:hypothetical protein
MQVGYLVSLFLILVAAVGAASIIDLIITPDNSPITVNTESNATTSPFTAPEAQPISTSTTSTTSVTKQSKATSTSLAIASTTPQKKSVVTAPTTTKPQVLTVVETVKPPPPPTPTIDASSLNTIARNALVNIYCEADSLSLLPSTIGSGMLIDPRGIILTNAHVAEHLLLESYRVPKAIQCYARNGSPARIAYKVNLLYLPATWVTENAAYITQSTQRRAGLGKNDFALLYITESATDAPLPSSFPYITVEYTDVVDVGEEVFSVAYPAELLPDRNKLNALYPVSAYSRVEHFITFTEDILDELYLSGNAVSQTGASGGGVVTTEGKLYAVIATVTDGATPQDRDFQAITIPYISRTLQELTGETLRTFLSKDPNVELIHFRTNVAPPLTAALTAEYQKVHQQ